MKQRADGKTPQEKADCQLVLWNIDEEIEKILNRCENQTRKRAHNQQLGGGGKAPWTFFKNHGRDNDF